MRSAAGARAARLLVVLGLAAAACGCSGPAGGGNVSILVALSGSELTAFDSVIAAFKKHTGINVEVEPTRALTQELDADLQAGDPPDVAALPSIGAIGQYADQKELKPLDGLVDTAAYGPPWSGLMRPGRGNHLYAAPVKADVKSLIWYDPAVFRRFGYRVPNTWSQLLTLDKSIEDAHGPPWCLAVSSTPTSGWPGTDWIADIVLSTYGPRTYQKWVSGRLPWTSGPVEHAWLMWNQLIGRDTAVYRGRDAALLTNVGDVHPTQAGCYLAHGTLVDEGFRADKNGEPALRFGADYDFFPFPSSGAATPQAVQVSADFVGMFNATPAARQLIRYLTGTAAQRAWVSYPGADGFSADDQVPVSAYPDPATRRIAALLTPRRQQLCFGASDAMSPDLSAAFDQAVLEYLADPAALTSTVLRELSKVPPGTSAPAVCGTPLTIPRKRS